MTTKCLGLLFHAEGVHIAACNRSMTNSPETGLFVYSLMFLPLGTASKFKPPGCADSLQNDLGDLSFTPFFGVNGFHFRILHQGVNLCLSLGKSTVSLTFDAPVRIMVSLSAPRPQPA